MCLACHSLKGCMMDFCWWTFALAFIDDWKAPECLNLTKCMTLATIWYVHTRQRCKRAQTGSAGTNATTVERRQCMRLWHRIQCENDWSDSWSSRHVRFMRGLKDDLTWGDRHNWGSGQLSIQSARWWCWRAKTEGLQRHRGKGRDFAKTFEILGCIMPCCTMFATKQHKRKDREHNCSWWIKQLFCFYTPFC